MLRIGKSSLATLVLMALMGISLSAQGGPGGPGGPGNPPPIPPLPSVSPTPAGNPLTPAKAILGKALFWDEQLSSDNTMSCGSCHQGAGGGSELRVGVNPGPDGVYGTLDDKFASPGVIRSDANNAYDADPVFGLAPQVTGRWAQSFINAGFAPSLFWDGRATSRFNDPVTGAVVLPAGAALESQAVGPIVSAEEMAHENRDWAGIAAKLQVVKPLKLATSLPTDLATMQASSPSYSDLFLSAFGSAQITPARIAMAIASYERTLISNQTPWDAFNAGNPNALTQNQQVGLQVFIGPGRCVVCHSTAEFTDHSFRNIGLRPLAEDLGRGGITGQPQDAGRFKVPSLRNVGLRGRFMHNGQFSTLTQVVDFYARGGDFPQNRDPVLGQINIPPQQRGALVDFLTNALTDPRVANETAPFDRPTLAAETPTLGHLLFSQGTAGAGGQVPQFIANSPPNIGNIDYRVGIRNAIGGATAWLAVAPQTSTLPVNIGGLEIAVELFNPDSILYPTVLGGVGAGAGYGTLAFPIPNLPNLVGYGVRAQWFVYDTNSAATFDYSASQGLDITLF